MRLTLLYISAVGMGTELTWRIDRQDKVADHGLSIRSTQEALNDPDAAWLDPDPKSLSGLGIRIIGWSTSQQRLVTVIGLRVNETEIEGLTAYPSENPDKRIYWQGGTDE